MSYRLMYNSAMWRILLGLVLLAGGLAWDFLTPRGLVLIPQIIMIVLGGFILGFGLLHWYISRR